MEKIFTNKVAIVTGGSFGIGQATAISFARMGAIVVIVDWIENKETSVKIISEGSKCLFIKCDVSKDSEVKKMVDLVIKTFGRIDFAFNNAGIEGISANTQECTEENWDKTISINLKGVWLCMKYILPHMLANKKGSIVNCASIAGLVGFAGLPAYVASKHAIVGLTKSAALENAKTGIRINSVCPGVILTPMIDRMTGKSKDIEHIYENMEPVGRMGQPSEVAEAVVWLCSESASFITGHNLPVDGGYVAQ